MKTNPGYESLAGVLQRALDQAQDGKGKERHANDLPFHLQPMQQIAKRRGVGFLLGQADKKSEEATSLPAGRDVAELLGAINYLAGAVIFLESQRPQVVANDNALVCGIPAYAGQALCGPCLRQGRCLGSEAKVDFRHD